MSNVVKNTVLTAHSNSSFISHITYGTGTKLLTVYFRNGSDFPYYNVPMNVFQKVTTAKSTGNAYNEYLRGKYS